MTADSDREREQRELLLLRKTLGQVDAWSRRTEQGPWAVVAGSALHGDDKKTDPFQLSHAVASALMVAVDHARALQILTEGCETCNPHEMTFLLNSTYSLLRGALENAARAIWLLAPDQRPERVLRRLRLQAANVINSDQATSLAGVPSRRRKAIRLARVAEIATRAGVDPSKAVKSVGNVVMVRAAGLWIGKDDEHADHIEFLWRACSAAAHGDTWAVLSLHDKEVLDRADGVVSAHLTASIHAVAMVTSEAFAVIGSAFHLLDLRNR